MGYPLWLSLFCRWENSSSERLGNLSKGLQQVSGKARNQNTVIVPTMANTILLTASFTPFQCRSSSLIPWGFASVASLPIVMCCYWRLSWLWFFPGKHSCILIGIAQNRNRYPDSQTNSNSGILRHIEKWERGQTLRPVALRFLQTRSYQLGLQEELSLVWSKLVVPLGPENYYQRNIEGE